MARTGRPPAPGRGVAVRRRCRLVLAVVLSAVAGLAGARPSWPAHAADPGAPVLLAAGDIWDCNRPGKEATASIVNGVPSATVAMLGDGAYPVGDLATYQQCYDPTWGQFKARTRPAPGNHDYAAGLHRQTAPGYFDYFGAAAGDPTQGFYSYDLGGWHIVSLNSTCGVPGAGCTPGAPQVQWLESDLAAHPAQCTLAYWHHPRFFSMEKASTATGPSSDTSMSAIWDIPQAHGADVVVNAHIHLYEQFPRQDSVGNLDPNGMREFIVGTGGGHPDTFDPNHIDPHSEARHDNVPGVLPLTLHPDGYDWACKTSEGAVPESGHDTCTPGAGATTTTPPPTAPA